MKSLLVKLALVLTMFMAVAPTANATADGPDFWEVHRVANWDTLNVRSGPGVSYNVVYRLAPYANRIQVVNCVNISTSRGPANWCLINHGGYQRGWVNSYYLREDSSY